MFELALALGRSVAEIERTISSAELTEWMAYRQLRPFGDVRNELHTAAIMTTIVNFAGKVARKSVTIGDMMPITRVPKLNAAAAEIAAIPGVEVVKYGESRKSGG